MLIPLAYVSTTFPWGGHRSCSSFNSEEIRPFRVSIDHDKEHPLQERSHIVNVNTLPCVEGCCLWLSLFLLTSTACLGQIIWWLIPGHQMLLLAKLLILSTPKCPSWECFKHSWTYVSWEVQWRALEVDRLRFFNDYWRTKKKQILINRTIFL